MSVLSQVGLFYYPHQVGIPFLLSSDVITFNNYGSLLFLGRLRVDQGNKVLRGMGMGLTCGGSEGRRFVEGCGKDSV